MRSGNSALLSVSPLILYMVSRNYFKMSLYFSGNYNKDLFCCVFLRPIPGKIVNQQKAMFPELLNAPKPKLISSYARHLAH